MSRCPLCTSNDRHALVEQLAGELWESRRDREIDPPWADCGSYWRAIFLGFARTALDLLASEHRRLAA